MLRLLAASLFISPVAAAVAQVMANGDADLIPMDDIEKAKSARLMKNKEDIDVQSTYHEDDIKSTGEVTDEYAARLVKNRGPITAKVAASGSHGRYCGEGGGEACTAQFSLVAWKFAGDKGTVHGSIEEKFGDGELVKAEVDCMKRKGNEAIVGGTVKAAPEGHSTGAAPGRRAYVKVIDGSDEGGDFVSSVHFEAGVDTGCGPPGLDGQFEAEDENIVDPRVSVCSKHGDWERCLEKMRVEQAIE